MTNKLFKDRHDSAKQLIDILPIDNMLQEEWIVTSSSSGGIDIAVEVAKVLNATATDVIITEKIFTPNNNSCEIAIISETEELVVHEELMKSFDLKLNDIFIDAKEIYNSKIKNYIKTYRDGKSLEDVSNKNVLIVDEGLNTGLTMMACIKTMINLGAKSVSVAVPILPESIIGDIEAIADDLYFKHSIPHFVSIDFYYEKLENKDKN